MVIQLQIVNVAMNQKATLFMSKYSLRIMDPDLNDISNDVMKIAILIISNDDISGWSCRRISNGSV